MFAEGGEPGHVTDAVASGARTRRPNTRLDSDGVLAEKGIRLKSVRAGHASRLTKLYRDAELLADDATKVDEAKEMLSEIDAAFRRFEQAHYEYYSCLDQGSDKQREAEQLFDEHRRRRSAVLHRLSARIADSVERLPNANPAPLPQVPEVRPEDSASRVDSTLSSASEIRRARAKQAVAALRLKQLKQRQDLVRHEEELRMQRELLEAQGYVEEADLEVKICEDDTQQERMEFKAHDIKLNVDAPIWQPRPNTDQQSRTLGESAAPRTGGVNEPSRALGKNASSPARPRAGSVNEPTRALGEYALSPGQPRARNSTELTYAPADHAAPPIQPGLEALAFTIRQGFSLPKPDLMKFDGNPLEYWPFIRSFENNIERHATDDTEKLTYLLQFCIGDAKKVIKSCVSMVPSIGYQAARKLLRERFGHPYMIATAVIKKATDGAPLKPSDHKGLLAFADELQDCENILHSIGYLDEINSSDNLKRVVERLPFHLRTKWLDRADAIYEAGERLRLHHICKFVKDKARAANNPVFGGIAAAEKSRDSARRPMPKAGSKATTFNIHCKSDGSTRGNPSMGHIKGTAAVMRGNAGQSGSNRCPSCSGNHPLKECGSFRNMPHGDRLALVRRAKLCDNCLKQGHMARGCMNPSGCEIDGCKRKHDTLLHFDQPNRSEGSTSGDDAIVANHAHIEGGQCGAISRGKKVRLRIVPVKVQCDDGAAVVETYALLDNGSDVSLCSKRLSDQLGAKGVPRSFSLTTQEKCNSLKTGLEVKLTVESLDSAERIEIPKAWTVDCLNISSHSIATEEDLADWPHLQGIELPSVAEKEVGLLIGSDVPEAFWVIDESRGNRGEPYAVRSPLGWTLLGPTTKTEEEDSGSVNFIRLGSDPSTADPLLQQVKRFWEVDSGLASSTNSKKSMSIEDKRALSIMEESIELVDGHYYVALPWRQKNTFLPNNRPMAMRRLYSLKRKLQGDEELSAKYKASIEDYLKQGYASGISDEDGVPAGRPLWYLPHHPVVHPQKPGKVRVVFDCAAKYQDVSLNQQLLQGPDTTNDLVGVLTRFRQDQVAIVADIEAMFHQVRVKPEDRDALRFLWWPGGDLSSTPAEYRMNVHLFGGTSSPSVAGYCLRRTAEDNEDRFGPEVLNTVKRNFYVDDCLKSVKEASAAITLAKSLRDTLAAGGFRLTKWLSNNKEVIQAIPESERAPSVLDLDLDKDRLPIERTLGMQWCVETDTFGFTIAPKEKPATRRGILSVTSSVYDPLGFLAPVILPAKKLIQDLCKEGLGWDDPIGEDEFDRWKTWLADLPILSKVSLERCIKPSSFGEVKRAELHHFADASQIAYGAVSYLRLVNQDGAVHCAFLMGKSRLAHVKPMTIPRLELTAAVLAVQLDKMLREELDIVISDSVFWSDSTTVLQYIRNESRRFHVFVSNRLSVIHDGSRPQQWRYVGTRSNPADDASRGLTAKQILNDSRWLKGPEFLWGEEGLWPEQPSGYLPVAGDDPEVKREVQSHLTTSEAQDPLEAMMQRYSSWFKLKKGVAWLVRFTRYFTGRLQKGDQRSLPVGDLTVQELQNAEKLIVKHVQKGCFTELAAPRPDASTNCQTPVKPSQPIVLPSSLKKLNPMLDQDGMIRVGGRLKHAPLTYESKHQIILPYRHHITDLIIAHHHQESGHMGQEFVLSCLRQNYWIIKGRSAVRRVLSNCFACRRRSAPRGEQLMADLAEDRLKPDEPPFTYVGVDYFGPIFVRRGRSQIKNYGCLFTCLTTRAVHIEVVEALDTDGFLNAFRRFRNRRGSPKEVRSDNGTNFHGGEREIRESISEWNQQRIHDQLRQTNITWKFNPPAASHMGGVWERMIRSVRKILRVLLKDQVVSNETLRTLMTEVEGILNSRPLTPNSNDPDDLEPLTPNHLLLLRSNLNLPPGIFTNEDSYATRRWKQVQFLADLFWKRWSREYLPTLQRRQKWLKARRNLTPGDLVLIVDQSVNRGSWPLARVLEVYTARDGYVRSARVATSTTTLVRPITKLCFLECCPLDRKDCKEQEI